MKKGNGLDNLIVWFFIICFFLGGLFAELFRSPVFWVLLAPFIIWLVVKRVKALHESEKGKKSIAELKSDCDGLEKRLDSEKTPRLRDEGATKSH